MLTAASGEASRSVLLHVFGILGIQISTDSLVLNAPPPSGLPDPGFVTQAQLTATVHSSDGRQRSLTWTSSNPGLATVDSAGLVQAVATDSPGDCWITATSVDDPHVTATASVHVGVQSGLQVGVY
ncbi:MAG: Ig-like domain-containing protein [Cyanobacteria bacterium REEB65]|nr:Ig-like domain-containing protein [Cyanobacteria bacterium REEB65]